MAMKPQPTAEDWIILRLLNGWVNDVGVLMHNELARKSVQWLTNKLGIETVLDMVEQLKEEN